jgi:hypothetical protein
MMAWYGDIQALTERPPKDVSEFVRGHSRSLSQNSQRSASSDGVVDEEDDEPFSARSAADIQMGNRQEPSFRPQPGGRFPSDIQVNAHRGLQAPLSPSSVSSGFLDANERDAVVATGGLPVGSTPLEDGYGGTRSNQPLGYGGTVRSPLGGATHAAVLRGEAHDDGTNPYTGEPLSGPAQHLSSQDGKLPAAGSAGGASEQIQVFQDPGRKFGTVIMTDKAENREQIPLPPDTANGATANQVRANAIPDPFGPGTTGTASSDLAPAAEMASRNAPRDSGFARLPVAESQLGDDTVRRPTSTAVRKDTISNLHIPGEFPRPKETRDAAE